MDMNLPDVDALKSLDDAGFARTVCAALNRYDMRAPGFNLAANANVSAPLDPTRRGLFLYPEDAQSLISTGIKALREYDRSGKICAATREEFILSDVSDRLKSMHKGDEAAREQVMNRVASRMTGIASLALAPAPKN